MGHVSFIYFYCYLILKWKWILSHLFSNCPITWEWISLSCLNGWNCVRSSMGSLFEKGFQTLWYEFELLSQSVKALVCLPIEILSHLLSWVLVTWWMLFYKMSQTYFIFYCPFGLNEIIIVLIMILIGLLKFNLLDFLIWY